MIMSKIVPLIVPLVLNKLSLLAILRLGFQIHTVNHITQVIYDNVHNLVINSAFGLKQIMSLLAIFRLGCQIHYESHNSSDLLHLKVVPFHIDLHSPLQTELSLFGS